MKLSAINRFLIAFAPTVLGIGLTGAATAGTPSLVIDVDSGRVIHAERATDPWFPASVTKLMTAYVALSEAKAGRISMDTPFTVSSRAASAAPSKMGFRPGTEVTLDNALKIIMVKSANDVAITIAEGVAGSVEDFAGLMNAYAQRIGMQESSFVNPNGLPDDRQRTSARDLALLGRALLLEFPEHQSLFQLSAIQLGKHVMANHNGLIGRYPGADGMKTGFICASGFNVVASASRGGRRLIAVVMGSPSAAERTLKAASLFDAGFVSGGGGLMLGDLLPSFATTPPNMRDEVCGRKKRAPAEEDAEPSLLVNRGSSTGNSENPTLDLSPTAFATTIGQGRRLGPRAPLQPVMVWTGRSPDVNVAEAEPPKTPKAPKGRQVARSQARALPASAQSYAPYKPTPILDESSVEPASAPPPAPGAIGPKSTPQRAKLGAIATRSKAPVTEIDAPLPPARSGVKQATSNKSISQKPKPHPVEEE